MIGLTARLVAMSVLLLPRAALAHPGHGRGDVHPLLHHLLEPEHALVLLTAAAVGGGTGLALWYRRKRSKHDGG